MFHAATIAAIAFAVVLVIGGVEVVAVVAAATALRRRRERLELEAFCSSITRRAAELDQRKRAQ